jgi:hypothetical protein
MRRRKLLLFSSLICTCRTLVPESIVESYSADYVDALQSRLLQMFGFSRVPNPQLQRHSSIPKVLLDMYHYQNGDEFDQQFEVSDDVSVLANTIRHHPETHSIELSKNEYLLKYDFDLPNHEELHRSELVLSTHQLSNNTHIKIYHVTDDSERKLIDSKRVSGASTERFDLTNAAQLWLNSGTNYGMILPSENGDATHIRMRRSTGSNFDDAPVMLSYTNDGGSSPTFHRSRRYVAPIVTLIQLYGIYD